MRCKPNQRVMLLASKSTTAHAMQFVGQVRTTVCVIRSKMHGLVWVLDPPVPPANKEKRGTLWSDRNLLPLGDPPPTAAVPRVTEDALQG